MANITFRITYFKVWFVGFFNAKCHEEKYFMKHNLLMNL